MHFVIDGFLFFSFTVYEIDNAYNKSKSMKKLARNKNALNLGKYYYYYFHWYFGLQSLLTHGNNFYLHLQILIRAMITVLMLKTLLINQNAEKRKVKLDTINVLSVLILLNHFRMVCRRNFTAGTGVWFFHKEQLLSIWCKN